MSVIQGTAVTGAGGAAGGYEIERSLRFNKPDSAYLNKTFGANPTSRTTMTMSVWLKRGKLSDANAMFIYGTVNNYESASFNSSDQLVVTGPYMSGQQGSITTTQVFRDPSSWYHFVFVYDTTNATASDRIRLYVNGTRVTTFSSSTNSNQNNTTTEWLVNGTGSWIGNSASAARHIDGYMAEFNTIDGQALDPTSFGEFNSDTGVWQPIEYTGTYGTNGFYLNFSDNSSTTTLGDDFSGNGNDWTTNNFSVTAGAGNDSLVDSPTRYGTDTGAGGTVRGNYATFNVVDKSSALVLQNGNLYAFSDTSDSYAGARATMAIPSSGKWYWEYTINNAPTNSRITVGIGNQSLDFTGFLAGSANSVAYDTRYGTSRTITNQTSTIRNDATIAFTTNDIVQCAYDVDSGKFWFGKNNSWWDSSSGSTGNPSTGSNQTLTVSMTGMLFPFIGSFYEPGQTGGQAFVNFGQRPFAYTAPSGFKALVTTNLPEPTIAAGNEYFDASLWTGNNGTQSIVNTAGFAPDLVWLKNRTNAFTHLLYDTIRGAGTLKAISSSETTAEGGMSDNATFGYLSTLNSDGFTVVSGSTANSYTNSNSNAYVGWQWKANGAGVSNTDGTITSTVSVNTTSGFSIVTWTANGSSPQTIGHGLGVAPRMIITKQRNGADNWFTYHASLGATQNVRLDETAAAQTQTGAWNDTAPTSSVFSTGNFAAFTTNGNTHVAYCFAPVAGFSSMGSYVGNGSADGPFIYTGFRPAWVIAKRSDSVNSWNIIDATRSPINQANDYLAANSSNAENAAGAFGFFDFLSNGFKVRTDGAYINASGGIWIYAAFASNPFAYSLAR